MEYIKLQKNSVENSNLTSVSMLFSGQYFENAIQGYKTLNVYGREIISYDIESTRRVASDGSMRHFKSLPPRILEVEYQLLSDNASEQQEKFNQLMILLSSNAEASIRFRDELDYRFYGEFESAEKVDASKLNIVSTFSIICYDPFKYKDAVTTTGTINIKTPYITYPDRIMITTTEARNDLVITNTNTNKVIRLSGEIAANSTIEINPLKQRILVNSQLRNDLLVLNSDFENFEIKEGDVITTNAGSMEIYQREKML